MSWIGKWKVKSCEQKYIPNSLKWLDKNTTLTEIISQNFLACSEKGQNICYNRHILCNIEINQLLRSTAFLDFPTGSAIMNCLQFKSYRRCRFNPWVRKISWSRAWQPTPICLSGESHGQKSLVDYSSWVAKSQHNWVTNTYDFYIPLCCVLSSVTNISWPLIVPLQVIHFIILNQISQDNTENWLNSCLWKSFTPGFKIGSDL